LDIVKGRTTLLKSRTQEEKKKKCRGEERRKRPDPYREPFLQTSKREGKKGLY